MADLRRPRPTAWQRAQQLVRLTQQARIDRDPHADALAHLAREAVRKAYRSSPFWLRPFHALACLGSSR